ncbi:MAG: hypothetical protein CI949_2984, partial [Halanaerobium sp.]
MPLKNKKHKKEDDGGGSPAWMTTF